MGIQYILGKPGTGKTTLCHREIAEKHHSESEGALILIVPEQFSFASEKALIAATGDRGFSRAQVLSFRRLGYYVFGKTGGIDKKVLEDSGKHMLLRRLVGQLKPQLAYFKSSWEKQGFLDALASSITEFYQYGIEPDELLERAAAADSTSLQLKLADLHMIYSAFEEYLEKEYISADALLDILAEKIPRADFLRGAQIWVDGFKSFTPQEGKVLRALISVATSVKFAFCVDGAEFDQLSKFDAFYDAKSSMEQIDRIAAELGTKKEKPIVLDKLWRHKNAADIGFLCANYLGFSAEIYPERPKNIRIFAAANIFGEIDAAAKAITMLTRDRGYRYGDIGVVAADLGRYEKFIPAVFSQYAIPVFLDARRGILGHPSAQFIFAALEVIATNWQYEAVFAMLRLASWQMDRHEIDLLENYVLAYNIRGRTWRDDFVWGPEDGLEEVNRIRAAVVGFMEPLQAINSPRAKYDITEIATRLYNFLEAIGLPAALENWMADARVRGDNEALRWHEQIWGKIMDALDKMLEVLGGGRDTVGGFAKVLEAGIADMGIAPPSMDQLVVGDLRRSRFGELKALIVLGANDGVLPSYPEGGGLLDNGDRTELLRRGMNLAGDAIAKIYEEEFLIYAGFSKPSEYLAIMYSKGSLEGKASEPTRVLERLGELFPRLAVTDMDDLPEDSIAQISAPGAAFGDLVRAMGRRAAENIPIPPILLDAYGYFNTSAEYAHRLADMGQGTQFLVQNHGLSEKSIRTLYGKKMRTSVSKLERYAGCPFSYFAEYNLTAKSRKLHEVAAVDMGSIYHDILAKFGGLIQSMANFDEANMGREVGNIIDQVLSAPENQVLHSSGKYAHYAHKMRRISEISAAALTEHLRRGDFTLAYNEVALEGIQIPMDGDFAMVLDGRIDRVDMNNTDDAAFVKIIDYKSGRKGFSLSAAFHGLDMQLLVYLAAFIQRLSQTKNGGLAQKILPAAAFYFNLLNPIVNFSRDFQDNPDAVRREMLRSFKMSGILLDDGDVIHAMDRDIEATSDILPVAFKKGSTPEAPAFKKESSVVSREAFDALMEHVMTMAATCGEKIFVGGISANPAKHKGAAPCTYCDFRSICKFDAADNSKYRHLPNLKSEEVLARLGVTAKGTL